MIANTVSLQSIDGYLHSSLLQHGIKQYFGPFFQDLALGG